MKIKDDLDDPRY